MGATVDERAWPLLVTTFEGVITDADLDHVFERHNQALLRRERFVHLGDARKVREAPNAALRKRIADWQREIEPLSGQYNLGSAMVIPNTLLRGALTAINWVSRPVTPQHYAATPEEAYAWCVAQLAAAGIAESGAMGAYLLRLSRPDQSSRP